MLRCDFDHARANHFFDRVRSDFRSGKISNGMASAMLENFKQNIGDYITVTLEVS